MNTTAAGPASNIAKYDAAALSPTALQRILARVRYDGDCWIWTGSISVRGYGVLTVDSVTLYAHRLAYRVGKGALIEGLVLDHLCRTPACVNPMHLEQVTSAVNTERGLGNGSKKVCSKGHEFTGPNLREWTDKRGYTRRYCIACVNYRNAARKAA